jgi:hypothetical protein
VVNPVPEAETVSVEVTGLVFPPLPLPHPFAAVRSPTAAIISAVVIHRLRRRPIGTSSNPAASATNPRPIPPVTPAAVLLVCAVTVTGVVLVAAAMVVGEGTMHVSPAGAPVQEKLTVPE